MARTAQGSLGFERAGARTVVRTAYAESPLRLLTPRNHGRAAWAYTSTLGGGFVDGDRVRLRIAVGEGAQAFVSSQGATRIYRSPRGCESELRAEVAAGGALVLMPDPLACFAGARYRQRTELELSDGASVLAWDVLSAGRSGERWAFEQCSLGLAVRRGGISLVDERWLLDPAQGPLPERLGRFDALANLCFAGPLSAGMRDRLALDGPVAPRAPVVISASRLADDAMLVRLAAISVEELIRELRARLRDIPLLLGDDPWARRAA